jgi:rsbT co-antagonist protein RsbR
VKPSAQKHSGADNIHPEEMGVDEHDIDWRKRFNQFDDSDADRLRAHGPHSEKHADSVIDEFYQHIMSFDETRAFFRDPKLLERVKRLQKEYFLQLTRGQYGEDYIRSRLKIGFVHQRINLPLKTYFGMYNYYLRAVARRFLLDESGPTREKVETYISLLKLVFLDISLALEGHVFLRERTIHEQARVIRELSTPVLQLRDKLLIVPLIGMVDAPRARQLTEQLLRSIRANRARVAVIDITGVGVVDSAVANNLIQTVEASRLMGATVIITGISSEVAQTLVRIGVDLSKLNTVGDLQEGIAEAERLLGYKVVRVAPQLGIEAEEPLSQE